MGKIAKIQLRGISRAPSDRMTSDGGCAESLNVYLDSTETAPVLTPDDKTNIVGSGAKTYKAKRIFIHKTANYTNYILHLEQGNQIGWYYSTGVFKSFLTLKAGEVMNDINAVGNIIVVATSLSVYYILWKNNTYAFIGSQLPVPAIQIDVIGNDDEIFSGKNRGRVGVDSSGAIPGFMAIAQFNKSAWEEAARGVAENEDVNTAFKQMTSDFWAAVQIAKNRIGKWGFFSCPRFVRYAIKLYDGSYVYHSVPILIGVGSKEWLTVTGSSVDVGDKPSGLYYDISLFYKAYAKLISWDVEGWEDIIAGVDIFISTDIAFPAINEDFATCDNGGGKIYFKGYDEAFDRTKDTVLSKTLFYKVESIAVRDLDSLKKGIDLHKHDFVEQDEDLVVRDRLTSDYMTSHKVIPRTMDLYNNSLLINSAKIELPEPYPLLNGLFCNTKLDDTYDKYQTAKTYQLKFRIKRNNGEEYSVMARNSKGEFDLTTPLISNGAPSSLERHWYAQPMAWISYPDVNCYMAELFVGGGEIVHIPMSQHPGLSVAYAFVGLDKFIEQSGNVAVDDDYDFSEKKVYDVSNQVMMSEMNNPFTFPAEKRNTLQSTVIGTAIATAALSQGQFGQFPIYAFTEEGIWALETGADGSFVSSKPLSRETCLPGAAIASLDQAVVFISAKGVMLLSGSQIADISPYMNGRHYVLENTPRGLIEKEPYYEDLVRAITDDDPFMKFMADAKIAYDYSGKRLIFISPSNQGYQYIYKLDTETWHKMSLGLNLSDTINSYPDCLVMASTGDITKIYDLSTKLDIASDDQQTPKSVIITRPFDLDEPDVYKSIKNIRIRGQYTKGHVRFILLGSEDGLNFYTLNTLRGKSWKVFRMIILAHLDPTERLSWIDIEYEPRFTNRLR